MTRVKSRLFAIISHTLIDNPVIPVTFVFYARICDAIMLGKQRLANKRFVEYFSTCIKMSQLFRSKIVIRAIYCRFFIHDFCYIILILERVMN